MLPIHDSHLATVTNPRTNWRHRLVAFGVSGFQQRIERLAGHYADWRVGALKVERLNTTEHIILTFDDYGTAAQVTDILNVLRAAQVCGVFFIQGDWAKANPKLVAAIEDGGHLIGNHTYSHPDLLTLSHDEITSELQNGVTSQWLRPPRGRYNASIRQIATNLGLSIKYWSLDSNDWQGLSAPVMEAKLLAGLHNSAVILFHLHAAHTAELLPSLIREIRARGFKLAATRDEIWGGERELV